MQRRTFVSMATGAAMAVTLEPIAFARELELKRPASYPDPAVEVVDPRFAKYAIISAAVERLFTGARWAEGPVWFGDGGYLLFSDIPNNRMLRWLEETGEVTVFRKPSNYSNGNCRDRQGRLLTCEHDSRRVTRTEYDGTITVLMDGFQGKKLNAPNDVVVHSDGAIWFTDPGYGIMSNYEGHKAAFELPTNVYRLDPKTRVATVVVGDMDKAQRAVLLSRREVALHRGYRKTEAPRRPASRFGFMTWWMAPGLRMAACLRICLRDLPMASAAMWTAISGPLPDGRGEGFNGVHIFAPDGTLIGKIHLPEPCANLCFGGMKRDRLFMTASTSLYSLYVGTEGVQTF